MINPVHLDRVLSELSEVAIVLAVVHAAVGSDAAVDGGVVVKEPDCDEGSWVVASHGGEKAEVDSSSNLAPFGVHVSGVGGVLRVTVAVVVVVVLSILYNCD